MSEMSHDDSSLTMMDVLEEQEAMQEDADAVLGAGDDEHCTYEKGYMSRQAVYACLTCCPVGGVGGRAGVCLACSLHCHSSHTLVELYTKRNFKCDCGNTKIIMTPCKLTPIKEGSNSLNSYSHNYDGVYCTCRRPYPDPDCEEQDEMIQCCVCEDWLHGKHLGSPPPSGDQYGEMVCPACVKRLPFMQQYSALAVTVVTKSDNQDETVEIESTSTAATSDTDLASSETRIIAETDGKKTLLSTTDNKDEITAESKVDSADIKTSDTSEKTTITEESKDAIKPETAVGTNKISSSSTVTTGKESTESNKSVNKDMSTKSQMDSADKNESSSSTENGNAAASTACTAGRHGGLPVHNRAMYLEDDWRMKLCRCESCKSQYSKLKVSFLTDPEDTISHYESAARRVIASSGRTSRERSVERELHALDSVDRVTRVEMMSEYTTLSTELRDYLRTFAETGKVVRDEDIREFFAGLQARKKQKTSHGQPPDSCKF